MNPRSKLENKMNNYLGYDKGSKTKRVFPTDDSLLKILYLATIGVSKKWTVPIRECPLILGQLMIHFSDRI